MYNSMHSDVIGRFFIMKYIHIIIFLLTHDLTELKEYWQSDVIKNKDFRWRRLFRRYRKSLDMNTQYWFWWRLANEMFLYGNKKQRIIAIKINFYLIKNYNIDIMLGTKIGVKPCISHFSGIVITAQAKIGNNFTIKQNSTVGVKTLPESHGGYADSYNIFIGNNVTVGANVCIIADNIRIGDNVIIGAMSFINKDIPDFCRVYDKKELIKSKSANMMNN